MQGDLIVSKYNLNCSKLWAILLHISVKNKNIIQNCNSHYFFILIKNALACSKDKEQGVGHLPACINTGFIMASHMVS